MCELGFPIQLLLPSTELGSSRILGWGFVCLFVCLIDCVFACRRAHKGQHFTYSEDGVILKRE